MKSAQGEQGESLSAKLEPNNEVHLSQEEDGSRQSFPSMSSMSFVHSTAQWHFQKQPGSSKQYNSSHKVNQLRPLSTSVECFWSQSC